MNPEALVINPTMLNMMRLQPVSQRICITSNKEPKEPPDG